MICLSFCLQLSLGQQFCMLGPILFCAFRARAEPRACRFPPPSTGVPRWSRRFHLRFAAFQPTPGSYSFQSSPSCELEGRLATAAGIWQRPSLARAVLLDVEKGLTLNEGENDLVVSEVGAELRDLGFLLKNLGLLCSFLFRQILHFVNSITI